MACWCALAAVLTLSCFGCADSSGGGPAPDLAAQPDLATPASGCGPSSCDGCCAGDLCISAANRSASQCGSGGNACAACMNGQSCTAGSCQAMTCNGCMQTGSCLAGNLVTACGKGGAACVACAAGQLCEDGACLTPPSSCNAANCPSGCCDANGTCQSGTTNAACGAGSNQCGVCALGASCVNHACVTPCGPTNCAGCCDGSGTCVATNSSQKCGVNGVVCADCGTGTCSNGTCVSQTCASQCGGCCDGNFCDPGTTSQKCGTSGGACAVCGGMQTCQAGVCAVDPDSLWDIYILDVTDISERDLDDDAWDAFGGLPDPFVKVIIGPTPSPFPPTGETTDKDDTLTASWTTDGLVVFPLLNGLAAKTLLGATHIMEVIDKDVGGDDSMGQCPLQIAPKDFDAISFLPCPRNAALQRAGWQVRYRIKPHP